jgi:hypothetical protein
MLHCAVADTPLLPLRCNINPASRKPHTMPAAVAVLQAASHTPCLLHLLSSSLHITQHASPHQVLTSCETAVDAPGGLTGMLQLNCCPAAFVISVLRMNGTSGSSEAASSTVAAQTSTAGPKTGCCTAEQWVN